MMGNNGTKSSAQLDREVNDILRARQKREVRERAVAPRSSGIPSQAEYEQRELREANQRLTEVERAPLADRKEAAVEFLAAMRDDPDLVAERVGWLLDGNYGYGQMLMAKRVLGAPRMNRVAALTQMVAAFEWSSPGAMTREAWKKLTKARKWLGWWFTRVLITSDLDSLIRVNVRPWVEDHSVSSARGLGAYARRCQDGAMVALEPNMATKRRYLAEGMGAAA
jgi:hypothetical protein